MELTRGVDVSTGRWGAWLMALLFSAGALAYDSREEMIDDKLKILASGTVSSRIEMLERLQWSGLADERLFDAIAEMPPERYQNRNMDKTEYGLLAHRVRALGYSGNERYRSLLEDVRETGGQSRLRGHAGKALAELERFHRQNELVAQSDLAVDGKSFEVVTYMKMLDTNDVEVQRNAARAVYHERRVDSDLLAMIAEKLKAGYPRDDLSASAQDTMAWFARTLGNNAIDEYRELLVEVADNTPSKKLRRYALKYTR